MDAGDASTHQDRRCTGAARRRSSPPRPLLALGTTTRSHVTLDTIHTRVRRHRPMAGPDDKPYCRVGFSFRSFPFGSVRFFEPASPRQYQKRGTHPRTHLRALCAPVARLCRARVHRRRVGDCRCSRNPTCGVRSASPGASCAGVLTVSPPCSGGSSRGMCASARGCAVARCDCM